WSRYSMRTAPQPAQQATRADRQTGEKCAWTLDSLFSRVRQAANQTVSDRVTTTRLTRSKSTGGDGFFLVRAAIARIVTRAKSPNLPRHGDPMPTLVFTRLRLPLGL